MRTAKVAERPQYVSIKPRVAPLRNLKFNYTLRNRVVPSPKPISIFTRASFRSKRRYETVKTLRLGRIRQLVNFKMSLPRPRKAP